VQDYVLEVFFRELHTPNT